MSPPIPQSSSLQITYPGGTGYTTSDAMCQFITRFLILSSSPGSWIIQGSSTFPTTADDALDGGFLGMKHEPDMFVTAGCKLCVGGRGGLVMQS